MLALFGASLSGDGFTLELPEGADVAALIQACASQSGFAGHTRVMRDDGALLQQASENLTSAFELQGAERIQA